MHYKSLFSKRFSLTYSFMIIFVLLSFILRIGLFFTYYHQTANSLIEISKTLLIGFSFDIAVACFFSLLGSFYVAILPNRWINSIFDKAMIYFFFTLTMFIIIFVFVAEITFWEEFKNRFDFVAVDYLIYTYEVVSNIQQSYNIPLILSGIVILTVLLLYVLYRKKQFANTLSTKPTLLQRIITPSLLVIVCILFGTSIDNRKAEFSNNRYTNELSKAGIYSFFSAFRNMQLPYSKYYNTLPNAEAFSIMNQKYGIKNNPNLSLKHMVINDTNQKEEIKPNVIFILVESLSGNFMHEFGNNQNITPNLDSLAQHSLFFENIYANGTRTVRGMEAVTLSIPPTPGQSIVKRPENGDLFNIATVFKTRNYDCSFIYGGDGYFDNMNSFYGGCGFDIYDRGRGSVMRDAIKTTRHLFKDEEVHFENAWGICDEDSFDKNLQLADQKYKEHKPFFNFVMTTSNHRPYTYPEGKIDIPSGTGREGAVKYTDYAIGKMLEKAKTKPWFNNTVFVIIADHCASSAGKNEIDVNNHHIPAFIYNLPNQAPEKISKLCSQIDIMPTLFAKFRWNYESTLYGQDILSPQFEERAFVASYRKLGYMKNLKEIVVLADHQKITQYKMDSITKNFTPMTINKTLLNEAISYYQTADYQYSNKLLKYPFIR